MTNLDETKRILIAQSQEQIANQRDEEITKRLKLKLVFNELKNMRLPSNVDLPPESVKNIERAQKILQVSEYLQMNSQHGQNTQSDDTLLGLRELQTINLSYIERKAVREQLIKNLHKNLTPIADISRRMREEMPEMFTKLSIDSNATDDKLTSGNSAATNSHLNEIEPMFAKILLLEERRRDNIKRIAELKTHKLELLKEISELKLGSTLGDSLDVNFDESRLHNLRANALRDFLAKELVSNQNTVDAIKQVEANVRLAIEKAMENDSK